jgi:hypothetical protein
MARSFPALLGILSTNYLVFAPPQAHRELLPKTARRDTAGRSFNADRVVPERKLVLFDSSGAGLD